jgi:superfamily II RNA helicase
MLPTLKEVIERLFTNRLIKVIFTTETFSLGINMPARTVLFDGLGKFYGRHYRALKTRDFYQMAGRAGRRSLDKEGFVFSRVNPRDIPLKELHRIIHGQHEPVNSQFNTSYATVMHLYEMYGENLYEIYPKSFHYFQRGVHARKRALDLIRAKVNILKELGYIEAYRLTEKGRFASKVYGYELSLSELYEEGFLEELSEEELGLLAVALVFEPRKIDISPPISRKARRLKSVTDDLMHMINNLEKKYRLTRSSKKYFYHLSTALEAWIAGKDFRALASYTKVDEGELIRYFRMAIQILREILSADVSPSLREKIKRILAKINRGIIDAEKQLRM